ncbi:hypothetical protein D9M72_157140 [compost metagenome]
MPELDEDPAAGAMHCVGGALPSCDLLGRVDPWRVQVAAALSRDLGAFGDDQAGAGTLGVIRGHIRRRDGVDCPGACHRRHDDAIWQLQAGKVIRIEEGCHGKGSG